MDLRVVGYYREMFPDDLALPLMRDSLKCEPVSDVAKIVHYLRSGVMTAGCMGMVLDVFAPEKGEFLECDMLTDGVYEWRADLAYYVEKYNLALPIEFLEHVRSNDWMVPDEASMDPSIFE